MAFIVSPNSTFIVDGWCGLNISESINGKWAVFLAW
jgi:hypothetical protein